MSTASRPTCFAQSRQASAERPGAIRGYGPPGLTRTKISDSLEDPAVGDIDIMTGPPILGYQKRHQLSSARLAQEPLQDLDQVLGQAASNVQQAVCESCAFHVAPAVKDF